MSVKFSKYEGAGNDFILIDNRAGTFGALEEEVRALCDRRFGIGADGLMFLEEDRRAEFRMRYFNADGPEASMCGNGGRCIVLFAHHLGIGGSIKRFVAVDGPHSAAIGEINGESAVVSLGMGDVSGIRKVGSGFLLDTGSPHYVEFVDDVDAVDVFARGRQLRNSAALAPGGANINFAQITGSGSLKIRTYERGVEDETLACGTGAVACAIAACVAHDPALTSFSVQARGGMLNVSFATAGSDRWENVELRGPARRVFRGEFETENFLSGPLLFEKNR